MTRPYNFSAGPAALPESVLRRAAAEMLDWHGSGMSVMEMSHRGKDFGAIYQDAHDTLRELLNIPANYKILFMQGGGLAENAIVPLNLIARTGKADFIITGSWSAKSIKEAAKYGDVREAASNAQAHGGYGPRTYMPARETWALRNDAAYLHVCGNETIDGIEFFDWPTPPAGVPLVADVSSHILSRPMNVAHFGLMFGGAQKNIGPAGLTIVIVRDDLIGHALPACPSAFDYKIVADNGSMFNTPPTYAIYIAGLVFQWLKAQGGVAGMEQANIAKAKLLYDFLDDSSFYQSRIETSCRSRMNVPFFLADESRNDAFLAGAKEAGLLQLKGHKSVGGMRASIYNAMPLAGVQALVDFMKDFEKRQA
jgi:phosphoserine aminotransferase